MSTSPFDQTGARDRGFALHLSGYVMFVITPWNALWEFQALCIVVKQAVSGSGQRDKYGEYEMAKTELNIVEANLTRESGVILIDHRPK